MNKPRPHHQVCANVSAETGAYLNMVTMQKMIDKFLIEKHFSKQELAELLGIQSNELEQLNLHSAYTKLAPKISLPLIRLYCKTKWK